MFILQNFSNNSVNEIFSRDRRQQFATTSSDNKCRANEIRIDGIRIVSSDKEVNYDDDNVPHLYTRTNARLRLFGCGFTDHTVITFTQEANDREGSCLLPASGQFKVLSEDLFEYTAIVDVVIPNAEPTPYFICVKNAEEALGEKVCSCLFRLSDFFCSISNISFAENQHSHTIHTPGHREMAVNRLN